jgi:hypothetical protein
VESQKIHLIDLQKDNVRQQSPSNSCAKLRKLSRLTLTWVGSGEQNVCHLTQLSERRQRPKFLNVGITWISLGFQRTETTDWWTFFNLNMPNTPQLRYQKFQKIRVYFHFVSFLNFFLFRFVSWPFWFFFRFVSFLNFFRFSASFRFVFQTLFFKKWWYFHLSENQSIKIISFGSWYLIIHNIHYQVRLFL